ncbi:GNAT family N-acetyltransferase [Herbaspirillum camelliae]|uniref:GNAT family N-acetyltransferase n=1 Tax=Herbaspirillum camelliae TaxID=1892903 RepID=UPI000949CC8A|nr:GNAT family N-acetyltransferase [Herbaspirillum camelliae]
MEQAGLTTALPAAPYLAHVDGHPYAVEIDGDVVRVRLPSGEHHAWRLQPLATLNSASPAPTPRYDAHPAELAALEALWSQQHGLAQQLILPDGGTPAWACPGMFWQQHRNWLVQPQAPLPLRHCISAGKRHPQRPAKPAGTVYRRHIPWLGQTLSLRAFEGQDDLVRLNRWMNDPDVAYFWEEQGDLDHHRHYLARLADDPHAYPLIACLDELPFAYFEIYWAREDRIAPFADPGEHDRGWHVLVGEPAYRGREFVSAWMPSVSHYLLLEDVRTERLWIEPRADNRKMLRSLQRSGYALLKEFDFPHKRAMLGMLSRERFFGERLWMPGAASAN